MSWLLNGLPLQSNARFKAVNVVTANRSSGVVVTSELVMIGITRDKAGVLACKADSSVGAIVFKTNVIINRKYSSHFLELTMQPLQGDFHMAVQQEPESSLGLSRICMVEINNENYVKMLVRMVISDRCRRTQE